MRSASGLLFWERSLSRGLIPSCRSSGFGSHMRFPRRPWATCQFDGITEVKIPPFFHISGEFKIESNWDIFAARIALISNLTHKVVKEAPTQVCKALFVSPGLIKDLAMFDTEESDAGPCSLYLLQRLVA